MTADDADSIIFTDLSKFMKKSEVPPYPLVGIVGQQVMKKALLLTTTTPFIGNMIIIGEAGTGKSTAARGLRGILPEMEAVTGCFYNCDPKDKSKLCQDCQSTVSELHVFTRRLPLVELPLGASGNRVFGGFDSQSMLRPGYVGRANRGFLLISRVNLLDPDILNRILDISATGIHRSQSEHGDFTHPAKFNIIATMNPEDGEIDAEIMERFSMAVKVQSIKDIEERIEIVRRVEAYRQDPVGFVNRNRREMEAFSERLKRARDIVKRVDIPKKVLTTMDKVLKQVGQDNDRVRTALAEAAQANAAFGDRVWVTVEDVAEIAELVLGHRAK
jgi:Mg-chelatase subunit ChlI